VVQPRRRIVLAIRNYWRRAAMGMVPMLVLCAWVCSYWYAYGVTYYLRHEAAWTCSIIRWDCGSGTLSASYGTLDLPGSPRPVDQIPADWPKKRDFSWRWKKARAVVVDRSVARPPGTSEWALLGITLTTPTGKPSGGGRVVDAAIPFWIIEVFAISVTLLPMSRRLFRKRRGSFEVNFREPVDAVPPGAMKGPP
jgi:hypothetical protein